MLLRSFLLLVVLVHLLRCDSTNTNDGNNEETIQSTKNADLKEVTNLNNEVIATVEEEKIEETDEKKKTEATAEKKVVKLTTQKKESNATTESKEININGKKHSSTEETENNLFKPDPMKIFITGMELVDVKKAVSDDGNLSGLLKKDEKLPDWLKTDDLLEKEDRREKKEKKETVLSELSKDINIESEFDDEEKKTVYRFIEALTKIATAEKRMTERKRNVNFVGNHFHGNHCGDERSDCGTYSDYCTSHKKIMKQSCAKMCGYCYDCDSDEGSPSYCAEIQMSSLCDKPIARKYCSKTCNSCAGHPIICQNSIHGCCWDKKTIKSDMVGSNCPKCEEKFENVCKMFKLDCSKETGAGEWMKKYCQVTCGICSQATEPMNNIGCQDEPLQAEFCQVWKNANWCVEKEDLMRTYCANTCGLCNY